jgi:hypothetical protein
MGGSMGILIGLVFLMTNKPALIMSLAAVAVCAGAGVALSWLFARRSDKR